MSQIPPSYWDARLRSSFRATVLIAVLGIGATVDSAPRSDKLFAPPPADAVVLFDGQGKNLFVSVTGGAINWPVEESALVSTPNGRRSNDLVSRLHFRDAEVHVEFMLPPAGDGNSGVYLHGQYELQILNSAGKNDPGTGDMGAVYGLYKPLVNAARAPGEWQTYDIIYKAPRRDTDGKLVAEGTITAWLNGRLIHDRVTVCAKTSDYNPYRYDTTDYLATIAKRQERTMVGPLVLQDHDSPVRFRNVWVKPLDDQAGMYDAATDSNAGTDSAARGRENSTAERRAPD
jgi:3-keto-disaccharide hydrolase